jgi:hypothetical protein
MVNSCGSLDELRHAEIVQGSSNHCVFFPVAGLQPASTASTASSASWPACIDLSCWKSGEKSWSAHDIHDIHDIHHIHDPGKALAGWWNLRSALTERHSTHADCCWSCDTSNLPPYHKLPGTTPNASLNLGNNIWYIYISIWVNYNNI